MIVAEIYTQTDGKVAAFVLRGHSDRGKRGHGYNIRCAEVSALSQAAYLAVRKYLSREVAVENHEHGGLGVELKESPDELTEAVFQTMLTGLREIEKVSPQVVKIVTIEMDKSVENNLQSKIKSMQPSRAKDLPELNVGEVIIRAEIFTDGGKVAGFSIEERKSKVKEFDIYRASIWALARAAFSCVKEHLNRDLEFETETRRLVMKLKSSPDAVTEAVFQTMLIGLLEIEKLAPQVVRVEEKLLGGEIK